MQTKTEEAIWKEPSFIRKLQWLWTKEKRQIYILKYKVSKGLWLWNPYAICEDAKRDKFITFWDM